ncbi:hypothetical protein AFLA_014209 [Aspergillus flavus NRRL3357]|nr:hypothetical protein AFLA_014209 [Aspergillus flavus NRRL3357]
MYIPNWIDELGVYWFSSILRAIRIEEQRSFMWLSIRGGKPTMLGKETIYYWALVVGPTVEIERGMGVCYHAKKRLKAGEGLE